MTDQFLERFEERRKEREAAERTFVIAGETLTFKAAVAPEVGFRLQDMRRGVAAELDAVKAKIAEANGQGIDPAILSGITKDEEMVQIGDETVIACLEPDSHPAWGRLRSPENEHPLTFTEIFDVADYLLARVSGVPTVAPAASSGGRTKTAAKSKGRSSSPATPATS